MWKWTGVGGCGTHGRDIGVISDRENAGEITTSSKFTVYFPDLLRVPSSGKANPDERGMNPIDAAGIAQLSRHKCRVDRGINTGSREINEMSST